MSNGFISAQEALSGKDADGRVVPGSSRRLGMAALLMALADGVAVIAASVVAKVIYLDVFLGDEAAAFWPYFALSLGLAGLVFLLLLQAELYEPRIFSGPVVGFGRIAAAVTNAFLILLGTLYVFKVSEDFSRGWILSWFALALPILLMARSVMYRLIRRAIELGYFRYRVALYATPAYAAHLEGHIKYNIPSGDVTVLLHRDDDGAALARLQAGLARQEFDVVILGLPRSDAEEIRRAVKSVSSYAANILLFSDMDAPPVTAEGSQFLGTLRMDVLSVVPASERSRALKAMLDYTLALVALILLAPLLAVVALAIKLDSPGPVFFRQRRYGQNNQIFRIFKFRTMSVTEDGAVVTQAKVGDPRVTRVGRLLRRTSIDELPQLLNVLLGDMSLVGPRPHAIAHDDMFEQQLDQFCRRRRVRPGLTGWAQVNGFRGETRTTDDVRNRMNYDLYYLDNWSIWFDIEILARTVLTVARGAY